MHMNSNILPLLLFMVFLPSFTDARPGALDELEVIRRQRETPENSIILPTINTSGPPAGENICFQINEIQLFGADLLPASVRQQLIHPWIRRCPGVNQIQHLVQQISAWYLNQGYITSRAFLIEQDLSQGVLQLQILEGRLQQITLDQKTSLMLAMAFPVSKDKPLNLRDIEQGIEQINRLRRQPVQSNISPGDKPGYSVVNLDAEKVFTRQLALGNDNSGQKNTGIGQINGTLIGNNLVGLAERWVVSAGRSSNFTDHDSQLFQASENLPWVTGTLITPVPGAATFQLIGNPTFGAMTATAKVTDSISQETCTGMNALKPVCLKDNYEV